MGSSTTKAISKADPVALPYYAQLLQQTKDLGNTPYQPYTGQQVAGFTGDQNAAFDAIRNSQGIWQPYLDQAGSYAQQAAQAGAQGTAGQLEAFNQDNLSKYLNPYTQNVVDATLANVRKNNATQQNDLIGRAISSGSSPFGGDRAGLASAELARNQDMTTNQTLSGLQSGAFDSAVGQFNTQNAALQQALQADRAASVAGYSGASQIYSGLGSQAQNANYQDINALLSSGGLQQQNQQQQLDAQYQNWQNQQAAPYNQLSWLSGMYGQILPNFGQQNIQKGSGASAIGQGLGLATSALGLVTSDERVKEDIRPVGELDDGQTVYSYRYKGDPRTQIGLLAQEVAQSHPEAVGDMGGGILGVDYGRATRMASGGIATSRFDPTNHNPLGINMPQAGGMRSPSAAAPSQGTSGGISGKSIVDFGTALKGAIQSLAPSANAAMPFGGGSAAAIYKRGGIVGYADGGGIVGSKTVNGMVVKPEDLDGKDPLIISPAQEYEIDPIGQGRPNPLGSPRREPDGSNYGAVRGMEDAIRAAMDRMPSKSYADGGGVYDTDEDPADAPWLDDAGEAAPLVPTQGIAGMPGASGIAAAPQAAPKTGGWFGSSWEPNLPLLAAGAAMLASRSPNLGNVIGEGLATGLEAYQTPKLRAAQLDAHPKVLNDGPTIQVLYPSDGRIVDTGIPNARYLLAQKKLAAGNKPKTSLSPVYGTKGGKTVLLQPNDAGELIESAIPEGVEISSGVDKVDLGTQWGIMDKRTGQVVGYQPKDIAGAEGQKALGKAQGEAAAGVPAAVETANMVAEQIKNLKEDPYLPKMLGPVDSRLPNMSENAARVQAKIDQLQGGAFLQARSLLKGGGAITDFEGKKAEQAFARMNAAQSEKDFNAALNDFNEAVQSGVRKLQASAGSSSPVASAGGIPAPKTRAEVEALPPGTKFLWNGKTVTRQ